MGHGVDGGGTRLSPMGLWWWWVAAKCGVAGAMVVVTAVEPEQGRRGRDACV